MKAMIFKSVSVPLEVTDVPEPRPLANQVPIRIGACAVCRTDLHVVDGEFRNPKLLLIPGHMCIRLSETG